MIDVSAVIPFYGNSPFLPRCLESLIGQVREVICIDDGSPDQVEFVTHWDRVIRRVTVPAMMPSQFLSLDTNRGFGAACNAGAANAREKWLLFVNSDVELLPGCVEAMTKAVTDRSIVGAKLLYPDRRIQHGGVFYDPNTAWFDHRYRFQPRDFEPAGRTEPCLVTGALLLISRAFFEELGGFDPTFRMAFEDVDLCLRALKAGGQVIYCGTAEAYHLEGATRGATPTQKAERHPQAAVWEQESMRQFYARYSREELARYTSQAVPA